MDLREAVAKEVISSKLALDMAGNRGPLVSRDYEKMVQAALDIADRILALCSADVVRRERAAFVACYDWLDNEIYSDVTDEEYYRPSRDQCVTETIRRYPEGGKR